jgi:hypothetical protein
MMKDNNNKFILHFLMRFFLSCVAIVITIIGLWTTVIHFNILMHESSVNELMLPVILCIGSIIICSFSIYLIVSIVLSFRIHFFRKFHNFEKIIIALCLISTFIFIYSIIKIMTRTVIH